MLFGTVNGTHAQLLFEPCNLYLEILILHLNIVIPSVRKSGPVRFFGLKIGNRQPQPARTGLDRFGPGTVENERKRLKTGENS